MSDRDSRQTRIRERFKPSPGAASWLAVPRRIYRFAELAIRKAGADDLGHQAAALAFTTIVSLVPLLAAFSFMGARWFSEQQTPAVEFLIQVLPYSEEAIEETLSESLRQAKSISGLGSAAFVIAAMLVFTTIEQTLNRIWHVPVQRPLRTRLLSFTMLLFWGPLVIVGSSVGIYRLQTHPTFERLAESFPLEVLPLLFTILGLTMLYWLVPYANVDFRSALVGGFSAALLLEGLRHGFGVYVEQVRYISIIYGSLGLVLFFMISVQLGWWLVLLGSEVTYCVQNFERMLHRRHRAAPLEGRWVGLAVLVFLSHRFRGGRPITPPEVLAERLQLETADLRQVLEPLLSGGLVQETAGDSGGYLLGGDPHEVSVGRVFELYEPQQWELLARFPESLTESLEKLRARLAECTARPAESVTVADLTGIEDAAPEASPS